MLNIYDGCYRCLDIYSVTAESDKVAIVTFNLLNVYSRLIIFTKNLRMLPETYAFNYIKSRNIFLMIPLFRIYSRIHINKYTIP